MIEAKDYIGKTYNYLTILEPVKKIHGKKKGLTDEEAITRRRKL